MNRRLPRIALTGDFKVEAFAGAAVFESLPHGRASKRNLVIHVPATQSTRLNAASNERRAIFDPCQVGHVRQRTIRQANSVYTGPLGIRDNVGIEGACFWATLDRFFRNYFS